MSRAAIVLIAALFLLLFAAYALKVHMRLGILSLWAASLSLFQIAAASFQGRNKKSLRNIGTPDFSVWGAIIVKYDM